jgi:Zn-dependent protease
MMDDEKRHIEDPALRSKTGMHTEPVARNSDGDDLFINPAGGPMPQAGPESEQTYEAQLAQTDASPDKQVGPGRFRKRRRALPLMLFLLTCVSTFFVGATLWWPGYYFGESLQGQSLMPIRQAIAGNWQPGLIYMACLLAILLTHEMGHFLATVRYRIPASYPYFLPLPINPLGTMGAVIGMEGLRANRRQLFDIGIAGPLAGLLVAVPIMWIGIQQLDFTQAASGPFQMDVPLVVRWWLDASQPRGYTPGQVIAQSQLNAYFMAGWVGLFVTGLNMLPVSQLDGGHVTYTLFGKPAHWIARIFMLAWVLAMVFELASRLLWLMPLLILLIGTDHPKTSDDSVELGWGRTTLGFLSLSIPFLCFAPKFILLPGS